MHTLIENRVLEAIRAIREIESKFGVSIVAKGRAYGGAWLMIRDSATGETYDVEELENEALKVEA